MDSSYPRRAVGRASLALAFSSSLLLASVGWAATPRVHAIVGARIVTAPGQVIERGTIVIRDGVITAVGANVAAPTDARMWLADSLTIYPGLIDAYSLPPEPEPQGRAGGMGRGRRPVPPTPESRGAAHLLPTVHPETRAVGLLPIPDDRKETLRRSGFTLVQYAPRDGILRGASAVVSLGDGTTNDVVVKADAAQVIALEPAREGYPGSLMGAVAVIRQSFMDAKWYREVEGLYAKSPQGKERPDENVSWEALQPLISGRQPALFVADDMLEVLRATAVAKEGAVTATVVGGGDEYKRVEDIAATGVSLIVPVNYPEAPDVSDAATALEASTEELRFWHDAPANAGILAKRGVPFALTAQGLKDPKQFRARVATAIERGLKPADALAAVTTTPAKMLGLSDRVGTIAAGKIANLTVTRGELFSEQGKVVEVWVDGARYDTPAEDAGIKGTWSLEFHGMKARLKVDADKDTTVKLVVGADTLAARQTQLEGNRLRFTVQRGSEPVEAFDLWLADELLRGQLSLPDNAKAGSHDVIGVRVPEEKKDKDKHKYTAIPTPVVMGNMEAWRMPRPALPAAVLVKNATIWTAGPQGILRGADLLVKGGKIAAVGKNLSAPKDAVVIDAAGKHVAPGIVDEHSHAAILGNVNECTNSVTCEVRIADVINSESENIYRHLAGGTTVMHLLHGSCNSIGGQCAVIKNKWGAAPDQLVFTAAPPTVKFALGENPKQSNWGVEATGRYPQTRAGVEQVIREAFEQA
jgi:imidazolonepropionase-like amidohydrolase